MPRNLIIVIVAACAVIIFAFVGFAVYLGPADHVGKVEWADPSRSAPQQPLLAPSDQGGQPPAGGQTPHAPGPGQIPGGAEGKSS